MTRVESPGGSLSGPHSLTPAERLSRPLSWMKGFHRRGKITTSASFGPAGSLPNCLRSLSPGTVRRPMRAVLFEASGPTVGVAPAPRLATLETMESASRRKKSLTMTPSPISLGPPSAFTLSCSLSKSGALTRVFRFSLSPTQNAERPRLLGLTELWSSVLNSCSPSFYADQVVCSEQ